MKMIEVHWLLLMGVAVTGLVLLAITSFLYLSWQTKRQQHRQLEQLLDEIKERQNSRKNKLSRKLSRHFNLTETDAHGVSDQLLGAEKVFLQHYIDQLLQQKPNDIVYDQLCELLDCYLSKLTPQAYSGDSSPTPDLAPPIAATKVTKETNDAIATQNASPEPDWGDVFD